MYDEKEELHNKISDSLYKQLIKDYEDIIIKIDKDLSNYEYKKVGEVLDNIIKIKTIQAMDTSAELVRKSREFQAERGK